MDQTIAKLIESRPALPDISAVPAVAALQAKLDALKARQEDLARQVRQALAESPTKRRTDAERLLADLDGAGGHGDDAPDADLDQRLAEIRKAQRICNEAAEIARKEMRRVVRLHAPKLLGEVKAWHRRVVVEAARLMVHLDVLCGAELTMLWDIEQSGLPEGCVAAELRQHPGQEWLIMRLLDDGILTGDEDWLPDHLRPAKPGVAAQAGTVVGNVIGSLRRAVGGSAKPSATRQVRTGAEGGHELWQ